MGGFGAILPKRPCVSVSQLKFPRKSPDCAPISTRYVKSSVSFRTRSRRSRVRRRRLAALVMIAAAIAAFAMLLRPHAHASVERAPSVPRDTAPVVALHRAAPEWGPRAQHDLQSALRTALAPAISGARDWSCVVISQGGRVLF